MSAKIKRCLLLSKELLKRQFMLDRLCRAVLKIVTEKYLEVSREMYIFAEKTKTNRGSISEISRQWKTAFSSIPYSDFRLLDRMSQLS
jgi:hypothetical protein